MGYNEAMEIEENNKKINVIRGAHRTGKTNIFVSQMKQLAMEAERMIGVTMEENISKVMELKRFL